jgi:hypothetical protein
MTDNPTTTATPNARQGEPGASMPTGPNAIPDVFATRHVDIRPTGASDVPTLDASRGGASQSPNAASEVPPLVDLRLRGGQPEQAAAIARVLRRR